jgi:alkyl hydroperoxide reductase subunit AhpF
MAHLIELFVSQTCPASPDARQAVLRFAAERPDIRIVERDVEQCSPDAERYGLFATPAIVIDGRFVLYGVPTRAQLVERCEAAAPGLPAG